MTRHKYFAPAALAMALGIGLLGGCSARVGYRVYDPGHSDYHVWDNGEVGYYNQWIAETHHPKVEYKRLRPEEQNDYWNWRHSHQ